MKVGTTLVYTKFHLYGALGMRQILALGFLLLSGCLAAVPKGPTTASPAQLSSCQTLAGVHNTSLITGLVLTGSEGAMASAETQFPNTATKNALAVGIVSAASLSVITTVLTVIEGQTYSADGCANLLGPLPSGVKKPTE
jgi:hypothetical protein